MARVGNFADTLAFPQHLTWSAVPPRPAVSEARRGSLGVFVLSFVWYAAYHQLFAPHAKIIVSRVPILGICVRCYRPGVPRATGGGEGSSRPGGAHRISRADLAHGILRCARRYAACPPSSLLARLSRIRSLSTSCSRWLSRAVESPARRPCAVLKMASTEWESTLRGTRKPPPATDVGFNTRLVAVTHPLSNVHDVHCVHGRLVGMGEVDGDDWATIAVSEEIISHLGHVVVSVLPGVCVFALPHLRSWLDDSAQFEHSEGLLRSFIATRTRPSNGRHSRSERSSAFLSSCERQHFRGRRS